MNETQEEAPARPEVNRVECAATKDPAVRLFILAALLLGFAVWCFLDRRQPPAAWDLGHINEISSYLLNNWGPLLLAPLGIVALIWGVVFLRRVLVADEEGIGYRGKQKIAWSDVTRLDASQLESRHILYVEYGDGGRLKLDAWKLRSFRELVAVVERNVPAEKHSVQ
jgi:hypothetical protein